MMARTETFECIVCKKQYGMFDKLTRDTHICLPCHAAKRGRISKHPDLIYPGARND